MAILGNEGRLILRREAPPPIVITPDTIARQSKGFRVAATEYWTGDEVYLVSPNGIPISTTAVPEGSGVYFGSRWDLGPNRIHVTDEFDQYYASDTAYFYNRGPAIKSGTYYIYRDQLGRISLYTNRSDALAGRRENRLALYMLDFGYLIFAPSGTYDYDNALAACVDKLGSYLPSNVQDEAKLEDICDFAPSYERPEAGTADYDNADLQPRRWVNGFPWVYVCNLQGWSLELSAPSVDTTAVGAKFGEAVKSLVTGGGSCDFFVERMDHGDDTTDSTALLRLLMLTEKGSKAEAEFWIVRDQSAGACDGLLPGDLYYSAEVLTVNTAVNLRPTEAVVGSANFVTTGEIRLLEGPN